MTKVLNKKGVKHDLRGSLMALAPAAAIVAMPAASAASATNNDENINGATISITDTGITTGGAYSQTGSGNAFTKIIGKYKIWVMGFLGIGVTTMVIFFIKNFLVLHNLAIIRKNVLKKLRLLLSTLLLQLVWVLPHSLSVLDSIL